MVLPARRKNGRIPYPLIARQCGVFIVAAYVVPLSESPMKYENKYLFFDSAGAVLYTYHKHQPVPGEPAVKGTEPLKVFPLSGMQAGSVICYDYDFPYLAKAFGDLGADLVADPSSDWRGIDPLHTRMAAFRAVEQGHSILRSTRYGLSAAITPYGEFTAQMSSFDTHNKIMMAWLPVKGITTIYSVVNDIFIYICIGFIFVFIIKSWRQVPGPHEISQAG
jgi:apolipoprotein N-acyltransferase